MLDILRLYASEYFRPRDLVDVGTPKWLGITIVALALMWVSSFPSLIWIAGLILALNVVPVTIVTAYFEYTRRGRQSWH